MLVGGLDWGDWLVCGSGRAGMDLQQSWLGRNGNQAYSSMDSHSGSARKRLWQALARSQYLLVLEGSTKMSIVVIVPEEFSIPAVDMFVAWWKWM